MASLGVKTAFNVAKPSVVSNILTLTGVHGHLTAALLAEMQDVWGSACFENSGTEFRYSRCVRQGGVERNGEPKAGDCPFGRQHDNEYVLRQPATGYSATTRSD